MVSKTLASLSCGAKFFRADLHIHSFGASYDTKDTRATPAAIVETAQREGLSIISLTDHNEIANVPEAVEAGCAAGVLVVPGVELTTPEGHLLCYAPTADALERFFNRLQIAARRTSTRGRFIWSKRNFGLSSPRVRWAIACARNPTRRRLRNCWSKMD